MFEKYLPLYNNAYQAYTGEFFSTTMLGKILGIKAKPALFDFFMSKGYLTYQNKKYQLTTEGMRFGKYLDTDNGEKFVAWNLGLVAPQLFPLQHKATAEITKFNALFHITHINNLESIFQHGLYCHSAMQNYVDISDAQVNSRRTKIVEAFKKPLHDYVPFYFNCRNAMLYRVQHEYANRVVILELDKGICNLPYNLYFDRNAASDYAKWMDDKSIVNSFPWNDIFSSTWHENGEKNLHLLQSMQAECLVYNHVPMDFITKVHCQNESIGREVLQLINSMGVNVDPYVSPKYFF